MKTTALHSCSQHQPISARNALLANAKRNTTPPDVCDTSWVQEVMRKSPGHRRARRPLTAKTMAAFVALCLAVIAFGMWGPL